MSDDIVKQTQTPVETSSATAEPIPPHEILAALERARDLRVRRLREEADRLEKVTGLALLLKAPCTFPRDDAAFPQLAAAALALLGVGDAEAIESAYLKPCGVRGAIVFGVEFVRGRSVLDKPHEKVVPLGALFEALRNA